MSSKVGGSTRFNVSQSILSSIEISIPSQNKHEKIADFISHFDKKVQLQQEKIDLLKEQKKGYIQSIFERDLKFKDSNRRYFKEFAMFPLGNHAYVQGGFAFKSSKFQNTGIPIIRISNVQDDTILKNGVCYPDSEMIDKKFLINQGNILIAMSGATTGKTGIYKHSEIAYLNQRIGKFEGKQSFHYPLLYGLLETKLFKDSLQYLIVAGAQPNISPSDIMSITLPFP
nr:restriction endonuclease subunit S [Psychrobacillus psychrodurans]